MGANTSQPEEEDKKSTYPNQVLYTDAFLQSAGKDAQQDDQATDEAPADSNENYDDDYDINSMHVSTAVIDFEGGEDAEHAKNTPDKAAETRAYVNEAEKLRQMAETMTKSMHEKTADLKEKYPPAHRRSDVCDYARQAVYRCYEDHENKLDCKDLVESYRQCSEKAAATESRRNH
ncbi:hypothetical protein FOL47_009302 [Perkinsus chesapeaki]|uniref:Uncharacterized protein n=1 Tax=Perkinsus chesapeaki TaxID=330153 RepID=A0A7J6MS44_PERCH|nr:hypothetical protein FOL47_009302 [Perkinsus chesapeaki]